MENPQEKVEEQNAVSLSDCKQTVKSPPVDPDECVNFDEDEQPCNGIKMI